MALPPRLWLPEGPHELPAPASASEKAAKVPASTTTPVQRLRRRALWRGEAGLPDRPVLVEWFPVAELDRERAAARRVRGLLHVHLLSLFAIGAVDARSAFAVSEAPDGVDLLNVLRAAPATFSKGLPPFFGVAVAQSLCRALALITSGHGRVNLGTVFVGWDGSVRLLAFSPLAQKEDTVAPELRLSERLLTRAADVYSVGALLQKLLPAPALRRDSVHRLLRRCLHPQAEKRISLPALSAALTELCFELAAPYSRATAIGEVLAECCPRATADLVDTDWGENTGDGFPALPPTLAPLSPNAVQLSPTWLRPLPAPVKSRLERLRPALFPATLGAFVLAVASLFALSKDPPPPALPLAPANPIVKEPESPPPARQPTTMGLRITIEKVQREADAIAVVLRLTNPGAHPIAPDLSALRIGFSDADPDGLLPLSPPEIIVGGGRVKDVRLLFAVESGTVPDGVSLRAARLLTLPLRAQKDVPK